jgi:hypothetical protein
MEGMVFPPMAEPAARGLPGVAAHEEVACALLSALRQMMGKGAQVLPCAPF